MLGLSGFPVEKSVDKADGCGGASAVVMAEVPDEAEEDDAFLVM